MKIWIFYGGLLLLLINFSSGAQSKLPGTWIRYNDSKRIVEIFIVRPEGNFVANLLNDKDELTTMEKGKWSVKGDSIQFIFSQLIASKNGQWSEMETSRLSAVTAKFSIAGNELKVGQSLYVREE